MLFQQILDTLALSNGAILCWQVYDRPAFEDAAVRGDIEFDVDTDCYVHPDAVKVGDYGYQIRNDRS
jgi:hypothetical protein